MATARSKEQIEALVPTVDAFLGERGLELNTEKTRIVHVSDGFNFLAVRHFRPIVELATAPLRLASQ